MERKQSATPVSWLLEAVPLVDIPNFRRLELVCPVVAELVKRVACIPAAARPATAPMLNNPCACQAPVQEALLRVAQCNLSSAELLKGSGVEAVNPKPLVNSSSMESSTLASSVLAMFVVLKPLP